MNFWQLKKAFHAGRISQDQPGAHNFTIGLGPLLGPGRNDLLASDLIAAISDVAKQAAALHGDLGHWVLVVSAPANYLTLRTISVNPNIAAAPRADVPDGIVHRNHVPEPAAVVAPANMVADRAEVELPAADPNEAIALIHPDAEHRGQLDVPLGIADNPGLREQATIAAHQILVDHQHDNLTYYSEIENRIQASPIPDLTRDLVINAKSSWAPTATARGVLEWTGLSGIDHAVPFEQPIGLTISVHDLSKANTGKIQVIRVHQSEFVQVVLESQIVTNDTIAMSIATEDVRFRLAIAMAVGLEVRIAVSLERKLLRGTKANFTVISAHCIMPDTARTLDRLNHMAEIALQQPAQMELWN